MSGYIVDFEKALEVAEFYRFDKWKVSGYRHDDLVLYRIVELPPPIGEVYVGYLLCEDHIMIAPYRHGEVDTENPYYSSSYGDEFPKYDEFDMFIRAKIKAYYRKMIEDSF